MTIEEARQIAAQAWCMESTRSKVMDPVLAEEFAKILFCETARAEHRLVLLLDKNTVEGGVFLVKHSPNERKETLDRLRSELESKGIVTVFMPETMGTCVLARNVHSDMPAIVATAGR